MKPKTDYQKRIDETENELELNSLFLDFMATYARLYRDTGNKEYLEMTKWIGNKKSEIIDKNLLVVNHN